MVVKDATTRHRRIVLVDDESETLKRCRYPQSELALLPMCDCLSKLVCSVVGSVDGLVLGNVDRYGIGDPVDGAMEGLTVDIVDGPELGTWYVGEVVGLQVGIELSTLLVGNAEGAVVGLPDGI